MHKILITVSHYMSTKSTNVSKSRDKYNNYFSRYIHNNEFFFFCVPLAIQFCPAMLIPSLMTIVEPEKMFSEKTNPHVVYTATTLLNEKVETNLSTA